KKTFTITLRNISTDTAVDFLNVSFQDSATSAIQSALTNRGHAPGELYELETQLLNHPSLRWNRSDQETAPRIEAGATSTFKFEITGKPGLVDALIQFDYANIGVPPFSVAEQFYTRQVAVPITVTVNASIHLHRHDILPVGNNIANHLSSLNIISQPTATPASQYEQCLLLLDLRNSWPEPLTVTLSVHPPYPEPSDYPDTDQKNQTIRTSTQPIQPGHLSRILLPITKRYLPQPYARIRSLNPANEKQFVVSANGLSPDAERQYREAFWHRKDLLSRISGTWAQEDTGRSGAIDLRGLRLNAKMVEALKVEDLGVEVEVDVQTATDTASRPPSSSGPTLKPYGNTTNVVPIDSFFTLRTTLHNRCPSSTILPLIRLQPRLADQPLVTALDLSKRLVLCGALQRAVSPP
ncbi:hypothetical protein LTS18_000196, partial [Coniosporium uncinatum]